MKNIAGVEVGIEVGMICRDEDWYCHIKHINDGMVAYSDGNSVKEAVDGRMEWTEDSEKFCEDICVGYHNPLGEDRYGMIVHLNDWVICNNTKYEVIGEIKSDFILNHGKGWLHCAKKSAELYTLNPLRTQSEKTPEQIAKEKWIADGEGKGWFRDGKILI
jgi:hypothetical protein